MTHNFPVLTGIQWQPASGASSQVGTKRDWWVYRAKDGHGECAEDARGRRRTFKTYEDAKRAADKLNAENVERKGE